MGYIGLNFLGFFCCIFITNILFIQVLLFYKGFFSMCCCSITENRENVETRMSIKFLNSVEPRVAFEGKDTLKHKLQRSLIPVLYNYCVSQCF